MIFDPPQPPYLFIIDYDKQKVVVKPVDAVGDGCWFDIDGFSNHPAQPSTPIDLTSNPMPFERYQKQFETVQHHIQNGNTYLLNLCLQTPIQTPNTLQEIYDASHAKFKLLYNDEFVVFSPERFIRIEEGVISTYPMKGTIDASIKGAKEKILADEKELSEHIMVVDLLRNDLSMVASDVKVERFRYVETIHAGKGELLQVSSKISGNLPSGWEGRIGDILDKLLPAGSITGAPKRSTMAIINEVESFHRGYFTGVFGYFDGKVLDSAVMIRYIENTEDELVFKSGSGITFESDAQAEYDEVKRKIYVPTL